MSKNLINNKKLAVIGCSGLVGSSILRCALEKGYEVNGTMRNIEDSSKIKYLKKLNNELIFKNTFPILLDDKTSRKLIEIDTPEQLKKFKKINRK